jgi:LPPG:FO 2-phospho-L-lactate transferase
MDWVGHPLSATGVAATYGDLLDGIVADEPVDGLPALTTDTRMDDAPARRRVAEEVLRFAEGLA